MRVAFLGHMTMDLKVLKCGNCEEIKLGVHAITLGLAAASWHALERPALALKARFRDGVGGRLRAGEATP